MERPDLTPGRQGEPLVEATGEKAIRCIIAVLGRSCGRHLRQAVSCRVVGPRRDLSAHGLANELIEGIIAVSANESIGSNRGAVARRIKCVRSRRIQSRDRLIRHRCESVCPVVRE